MNSRKPSGRKTALQALEDAQRIAFGPIAFQAARSLRDLGVLATLEAAGQSGLALVEIASQCELPEYGVRVLMEAGLGLELVRKEAHTAGERWHLDKTGHFILHDKMARANMDFTQDVCYRPIEHLSESVKTGKPAGLREFGEWDTLYQGLSSLPEDVQRSWFAFDHYYSDQAFPEVLPIVQADAPKTLLDIGGNTGKWAKYCTSNIPDIHVTILDLPGQLDMARQQFAGTDLEDRISFKAADLLDPTQPLPGKYDAIWMSQFLDCFGEDQITSILQRCRAALNPGGTIYILEHFWDEQPHTVSSYCLQMTSLYFTAVANGNSQMYRFTVFEPCIERAQLEIFEHINGKHRGHTLLKCRVK